MRVAQEVLVEIFEHQGNRISTNKAAVLTGHSVVFQKSMSKPQIGLFSHLYARRMPLKSPAFSVLISFTQFVRSTMQFEA